MRDKRGQNLIEFVILAGLVVLAVFVMGPMLKRGVQSLIKGTSDQIGVQENAEQDFKGFGGFMTDSNSHVEQEALRQRRDRGYSSSVNVNEATSMSINSITNLGFTPK